MASTSHDYTIKFYDVSQFVQKRSGVVGNEYEEEEEEEENEQ